MDLAAQPIRIAFVPPAASFAGTMERAPGAAPARAQRGARLAVDEAAEITATHRRAQEAPDESRRLAHRTERRLIRSAQAGSGEAVEELYRTHWPLAHRTAYLVVHDAAAAEDIAQEAFLAAVRALDRFDRRRPLGPWLNRIVVNRAIDWARARALRREAALELESGAPADEDSQSPDRGVRPAYSEPVVAALASLSPEHRAVVVLRHLLEYTPGEIAQMLDLPRGTVNSRLRRALDLLAVELGEERP
jgi:RNA polymerase sigma-70 factor (ECF subfamily)